MDKDTIVAIATPKGQGGVAIIRISGSLAHTIALQLNGHKTLVPREAHFCTFKNQNHEVLDTGLALYFKAPHSFTGEDVVELQVHGSPFLLEILIQACVDCGARLARPGEFTERAFLNDKLDLAQAEAVSDLIQASSQTAARLALRSLQGEFSALIHKLNEKIIALRLFVEAAIDFPEEEIDFLTEGNVRATLESILQELQHIRVNAMQGAMVREGLSLVIAGRPNAGKSTLINALAKRDVAIVTDIAGTTRDVMRESILLDELPLHVVDTAGLRDSMDVVEQEGIKRAWSEIEQADCILMVIDACQPQELDELAHKFPNSVPIIRVMNKIDIAALEAYSEGNTVYLSAREGVGLDLLKEKIKLCVGYQASDGQFLARKRHLLALDKAYAQLSQGEEQFLEHGAGELLAEDLRLAHRALGEIIGEFTTDDLLAKIFSSFCIGK